MFSRCLIFTYDPAAQLSVETVAVNAELGVLIYSRISLDFQDTGYIITTGRTRYAPQARWARAAPGMQFKAQETLIWDLVLVGVVALVTLDQAYAVQGAVSGRTGRWRYRKISDRIYFLFETFGVFVQACLDANDEYPPYL